MYNIGKMKKSAKKKLLIISLVFTLCFSACGTDKVVETEAEKIVEADIIHQVIDHTPEMSAVRHDIDRCLRLFDHKIKSCLFCLFLKFPDRLCHKYPGF